MERSAAAIALITVSIIIVLKDSSSFHGINAIHIDQWAVPDFAGIVEISVQYCASIKDDILRSKASACHCKQDGIGICAIVFTGKTFLPADRHRVLCICKGFLQFFITSISDPCLISDSNILFRFLILIRFPVGIKPRVTLRRVLTPGSSYSLEGMHISTFSYIHPAFKVMPLIGCIRQDNTFPSGYGNALCLTGSLIGFKPDCVGIFLFRRFYRQGNAPQYPCANGG